MDFTAYASDIGLVERLQENSHIFLSHQQETEDRSPGMIGKTLEDTEAALMH